MQLVEVVAVLDDVVGKHGYCLAPNFLRPRGPPGMADFFVGLRLRLAFCNQTYRFFGGWGHRPMPPDMPPHAPGCGGISMDFSGHSINKKAHNYVGLLTLLECGGTVFGGAASIESVFSLYIYQYDKFL